MKIRFIAIGAIAAIASLGVAVGEGLVATPPPAGASVAGATVTPFGDAPDLGALGGQALARPVIAAARTASGKGYWLASSDGGVFSFGDARFFGSTGAITLNQPIVGMSATPSGKGYWLVARDGGIFAFGDAAFFGSTGAITLNQPITAMASTPSGGGYWLVATDGGIFAFGDAAFFGSTGAIRLNQPITAMASTPSGRGYWLVARDGGVFAFGDAAFFGRVSLFAPDWQVFALLPTTTGNGYWQVAGPDPQLPTLQRGDTGPQVAELQRQLEGLGYWVGGASGSYDLTTQQAVYAFQKVQRLSRTGAFDPVTRAVFKNATRPTPRSTSGDLLEVDKARQVIFVVRNGRVAWTFNTSTGTETNYRFEGQTYLAHTPEGAFRVWSVVDGLQHGRLGDLFRPRYFTSDGVAVHGSDNVPPYPASHGCVRVTNAAINWIWANNIMPIGSTVLVY